MDRGEIASSQQHKSAPLCLLTGGLPGIAVGPWYRAAILAVCQALVQATVMTRSTHRTARQASGSPGSLLLPASVALSMPSADAPSFLLHLYASWHTWGGRPRPVSHSCKATPLVRSSHVALWSRMLQLFSDVQDRDHGTALRVRALITVHKSDAASPVVQTLLPDPLDGPAVIWVG